MPDEIVVDIAGWVERARTDPHAYRERAATEIILTAIGLAPELRDRVFLKGGVLMGIAYESPRQTADIDYTATLEPAADIGDRIGAALDSKLPVAAAKLGYPDMAVQVQAVRYRPRPVGFEGFDAPAIEMTIAYARRSDPIYAHFLKRQCPTVLDLEISFREPVFLRTRLVLGPSGTTIGAYSAHEVIAEKLRAFFQQELRNRSRRQDIYDLAHLIERFQLDSTERATLLDVLRKKCAARDILPLVESIDEPKLIARARSEWNSMKLEAGDLPDFDSCHAVVRELYRSLPW
jgi:hypothetical protein